MVEPDKDLDLELERHQEVKETAVAQVSQPTEMVATEVKNNNEENFSALHSAFADKMDDVKVGVLKEASENDEKFVQTVKDNLKDAAVKHTEVEQEKAKYAKQKVQYEEEKLDTAQKRNEQQQQEDKWENRQKRRQYHYNGVKPIMTFVGIIEPLNLVLLYFLTVILVWFFLAAKLFQGTIGALLSGASDGNRTKAAKGFIWTVLGIFTLFIVGAIVYLFLKWQGIILPL